MTSILITISIIFGLYSIGLLYFHIKYRLSKPKYPMIDPRLQKLIIEHVQNYKNERYDKFNNRTSKNRLQL